MEKKIRVDVKGTIVNASTEVLEEDFEQWVCVKDVDVIVDKDVITQSDQWGNFSFSRSQKIKDETTLNTFTVEFVKDTYTRAGIDIIIPDNTLSYSVNLLVKISTMSMLG